jgi:diguanylate cyclase (GGDEF)-like protein
VYAAGLALLAVLCFFAGAYAAAKSREARAAELRLASVVRRESDVLEAVRVLTAASRDSTAAVLTALDRTLRVLDPSLDAVLIFTPEQEQLVCVYAAGPRAEGFAGMRERRDAPHSLPARAALCGHRVTPGGDLRTLMPADRAAIAVPMATGDRLAAVVYASSSSREQLSDADVLVRSVIQAAAPYALAAEREADRASATYDVLTGLYTPRAFRQRLQEELANAAVLRERPMSLWFIDTDRFKRINDTFGHGAGDVVLAHMASLLRGHTLAGIDIPARNGGDEFCAIVRESGKVASIERAQRFCNAVRSFDFGYGLPVTASIGVAAFPYDAASASELLEAADAAMYHSKRTGRDRVSFLTGPGEFAVFG